MPSTSNKVEEILRAIIYQIHIAMSYFFAYSVALMDTILQQLISFRGICGKHSESLAAIEFAASYLTERGLYVKQFEQNRFPSLVATTIPNNKTPKVLLAAHMDVVSAPDELFTLRLENGIYYGRGVFDMLFAVSAYLHVVEALRDDLTAYDFGIMLTTDEEDFGEYGTGMLVAKGYRPQVCILPDASENWNIEISAKGCWFTEVRIHGKSSHGSRPWEGDSASIRLISLLHEITDLFIDAQQPHTSTLNIGILQAGASVNQTPDYATASLDIRFNTDAEYHRIRTNILRLCRKYNGTLQTARTNMPTAIDIENPLIAAFGECIIAETSTIPKGTPSFATSDARFFLARGIPCVLTSPKGGSRHADSEWLDAASYEQLQPILIAYLNKVARIEQYPMPALSEDNAALPLGR